MSDLLLSIGEIRAASKSRTVICFRDGEGDFCSYVRLCYSRETQSKSVRAESIFVLLHKKGIWIKKMTFVKREKIFNT
jgi:hypothetical protein